MSQHRIAFFSRRRFVPLALALSVVACGSSREDTGPVPGAGGALGSAGQLSSAAAAGTAQGGVAGSVAGGAAAGDAAAGAPSAGSGGAAAVAGTAGAAVAGAPGNIAGSGGSAGTATGGATSGGSAGAAGNAGAPAFDPAAVMAIMRRVANYEIARFGTGNSNGWVRAVFHTGMLAAYHALGDTKFHDYTLDWATVNNWRLFSDANGPRFADNQACVQSYAELYVEDPQPQNSVRLTAATTVFDTMVAAPMTGRKEWWWCDALFMAPAAMARVAQATGKTQYLTLMNDMFWDSKAFLYDPAQSLFWRDSTFLNTNTYWARGNGWVVGGIARILEALPATDSRRADYETLLKQMATKLRSIQASDGFWRSSLTQPNAFTTPESSGTAFFCFGLAWGINHGVLDRAEYLPTVTKAWTALGTAVNAQGRLGWVQAVGSQPGPSTVDSTNDYATGAFLLAGSEILKL